MTTQNKGGWTTRIVTVVAPGSPVQGPNVPVPDGFGIAVSQRRHASSPIGYIGPTSAAAADNTLRRELRDGEGFVLYIRNMNLYWFDSDSAGTVFELTVEQ